QHALGEIGGFESAEVLAHHRLDVVRGGPEIAAPSQDANEALEGRRGRESGVGKIQDVLELAVPCHQAVGGVEYGAAVVEPVEHRMQRRQAEHRPGSSLALFGHGRLPPRHLRPGTGEFSIRGSYPERAPGSSVSDTWAYRDGPFCPY